MKYYPIWYSLKVWLGSMLVGPLIATLLQYCISDNLERSTVLLTLLYPPAILVVALVTFFVWLIFLFIIYLIIRVVPELFPQKFWIMFAGMVLTMGLFYLFTEGNPFSVKDGLFSVMIGYASGITAGVWYFDLAKPIVLLEP
ncbi:MAG: hypothetical protein ACXVJB_13485 [Mucilaginibacter sp.]